MLSWFCLFVALEAIAWFISPVLCISVVIIFVAFLLSFMGVEGITTTLNALWPRPSDYDNYTCNLKGKMCLVTGANTGVGFGIAKELVKHGSHVIIVGRSNLNETIAKLKNFDLKNECKISSIYCDLSNYQSILVMLQQLLEKEIKLDICILNAGVAMYPPKQISENDKIDLMTMVNCLSNFIILKYFSIDNGNYFFNKSLLPNYLPQIMYVSSETHRWLDYETNPLKRLSNYTLTGQTMHYAETKLWNQMFAYYYFEKLKDNIDIYMTCPGGVASSIARNAPSIILRYIAYGVMSIWFQSIERGAKHVLYSLIKPRHAIKPGTFFWMMHKVQPSASSVKKQNIDHAVAQASTIVSEFETKYGVLNVDKRKIEVQK